MAALLMAALLMAALLYLLGCLGVTCSAPQISLLFLAVLAVSLWCPAHQEGGCGLLLYSEQRAHSFTSVVCSILGFSQTIPTLWPHPLEARS